MAMAASTIEGNEARDLSPITKYKTHQADATHVQRA